MFSFTAGMKHAEVTPIYKKDDKTEKENYPLMRD